MEIEISLTRALASKLNLKLEPTSNINVDENHFYADIITKNHQQSIMLFNSLFSWTSLTKVKEFKIDNLKAFKESLNNTLVNEGIKLYMIKNYLDSISSVKLSLTNNASVVSRMNKAKENIHFFYENYYGVPDAVTLSLENAFNDTICKNPLSNKSIDFIIPYQEMGYYLTSNYIDLELEELHHQIYFLEKKRSFSHVSNPKDLSIYSDDEINQLSESINGKKYFFYTCAFIIRRLYKEYDHPNMEDHFEFILKQLNLKDFKDIEHLLSYLRMFNLDKDLFVLYSQQFGRKYETNLFINKDKEDLV